MELIDKAAVVAEIEKRIKETESMQPKFDQFWAGQISAFKGILKILDTLEVKKGDSTDAFIEKTCEWLKFNYVEFTDNSRLGLNINELIKDFKKDFKKSMEKQQ